MSTKKPQTPLLKTGSKPVGCDGRVLTGAAAKAVAGQPGPGRPKGCPNKIRKEIAELVRDVIELAGEEKYLLARAKKNPNAFLALVAKLMPTNIKAEVEVTGDRASRLAAAEAIAAKQGK